MYIYIYTYVYIDTYIYTYKCISLSLSLSLSLSFSPYLYIYIIGMCTHICLYVCMYKYMYVYTYVPPWPRLVHHLLRRTCRYVWARQTLQHGVALPDPQVQWAEQALLPPHCRTLRPTGSPQTSTSGSA